MHTTSLFPHPSNTYFLVTPSQSRLIGEHCAEIRYARHLVRMLDRPRDEVHTRLRTILMASADLSPARARDISEEILTYVYCERPKDWPGDQDA